MLSKSPSVSSDEKSFWNVFKADLDGVLASINLCPFPVAPLAGPVTKLLILFIPLVELGLACTVFKLSGRLTTFRKSTSKLFFIEYAFLTCPVFIETCLLYWNCATVGSQSIMRATGVECFTGDHLVYVSFATVLGCFLFFAIPVWLSIMMYKFKKDMLVGKVQVSEQAVNRHPEIAAALVSRTPELAAARTSEPNDQEDAERVPPVVKSLSAGLTLSCLGWYQSYFWVRRLFLGVIVTFSPSNDRGRTMIVALLLYAGVNMVFLLRVRPFLKRRDNTVASLILMSVAVLGGLTLYERASIFFKVVVIAVPISYNFSGDVMHMLLERQRKTRFSTVMDEEPDNLKTEPDNKFEEGPEHETMASMINVFKTVEAEEVVASAAVSNPSMIVTEHVVLSQDIKPAVALSSSTPTDKDVALERYITTMSAVTLAASPKGGLALNLTGTDPANVPETSLVADSTSAEMYQHELSGSSGEDGEVDIDKMLWGEP
mmetsp:Transcript_38270/g.75359  ORF Transcript_38270/g.75359 Transcript_38270/m.75359 type:complete len:488 (+) Transcript_38270:3-1466(+)